MKPITTLLHRTSIFVFLSLFLLTACTAPATPQAPTPSLQILVPATETPAPPAPTAVPPKPTEVLPQPTEGSTAQGPTVTVNVDGIAQDYTTLVVEAVAPGPDTMWWAVLPQHTRLELEGYPVTGHSREPQIFVFPVKDLGVNNLGNQMVDSLKAFLQNPSDLAEMPFLPTYNEKQTIHAKTIVMSFVNGKGVRYLTQFNQGLAPINNQQLFYTFQGLTNDGAYYIAAVLPVYQANLPASATDTSGLPAEFTSDYTAYLKNTVNMLNQLGDGEFSPDLGKLDALVQSIEVK